MERQARHAHEDLPTFKDSINGDWISDFMEYTQGSPTPEIFRLWSAITAVSGALERRVWIETAQSKLYPNLFTLLVAPPGIGKCLAYGELVLTYDGKAVPVETVKKGDLLIGPDGTQRQVLETAPGEGQLYKVTPTKGRSWECNGEHILSLRKSRKPNQGSILHVTVNEWLTWSAFKKSEWKLWRTGIKEFAYRDKPEVDPYFIGVLLGDGDSLTERKSIIITTEDYEITRVCYDIAEKWGLNVSGTGNRYGLTSSTKEGQWTKNHFLDKLRGYGLTDKCGDKTIPEFIKYGSYETRRQILAGLIDTDGCYLVKQNCYDYISKSKKLSDDVAFLCRSLGLAAYVTPCMKSCGDVSNLYWRVSISGDCQIIPCKIPRKKAHPRRQIKNVNNTGFTIKPSRQGKWHGIIVDGDHQFLLDDFTVIHNTIAINPVEELWVAADCFHISPNNVTKAALVDSLEKAGTKKPLNNGANLLEYHSLLVPCGELGVLVPAHDLEFFSVLNFVFDNPRRYREERRTMSRVVDIPCPQLTILAGTQPGFLASLLPEEAWTMGFTSRLIMVYSCTGPKIRLFGPKKEKREELFKSLAKGLANMGERYGELSWDEEAEHAIEDWAYSGCEPVPEHSKLAHYIPRRILHTLKLCAISAMSRGSTMRVTLQDVTRAKDWLLGVEQVMPDIFREMSGKSDLLVLQELHFFMWQAYAKNKKPLHEGMLIHFLTGKVPSEKIQRIIDIAEKSNMMIRHVGTKTYTPTPKNTHGQE